MFNDSVTPILRDPDNPHSFPNAMSTGVTVSEYPTLIVIDSYAAFVDSPVKPVVTELINQAAEMGVYSQRFIYTPPYKPSKGKKNKFDRLNAIYTGQRKKPNERY